jgi:hypothetical protein
VLHPPIPPTQQPPPALAVEGFVAQCVLSATQPPPPPPFSGRGFGKEADARPSQRRWGSHLPAFHDSPRKAPSAVVTSAGYSSDDEDETAGGSGLADQRGPNWERNRARKERAKINKRKRSTRPITSYLPLPN